MKCLKRRVSAVLKSCDRLLSSVTGFLLLGFATLPFRSLEQDNAHWACGFSDDLRGRAVGETACEKETVRKEAEKKKPHPENRGLLVQRMAEDRLA